MLNNPDIQPNATINCWIAGILLFDFMLKHVPGASHGPDGLSWCPTQPDNEPEPIDNYEDWIDRSYGFMHIINPCFVLHRERNALSLYTLVDSCVLSTAPSTHTIHHPANHKTIQIFSNELATPLDFTPLPINTEIVFIPHTPQADTADHHLNLVTHVLQSASRPEQVIESEWHCLISYALHFFLHADNLWHKNAHEEHKIVIPPGRCLKLLTQVHDEVGHHGIYATHTHLVEHFWWPHMSMDIKWFTDSCHVCQTWHLLKPIKLMHY